MDSYIYTNVGSRAVNEDSADKKVIGADKEIFIVADGLGGHGKGEVASKLATDMIIEKSSTEDITKSEFLGNCIEYAQENIMKAQVELNASDEMKTTVVCLKIFDGKAQWAHVGDSRLYMWRKGKLFTRTLDHSVPQMLVASGQIKEKHIRFHEDRNKLIRVMGTKWDSPKYILSEITELEKGDAFLMCTDGFWELITEKDMAKFLKKSKTAEEWLEKMAERVNKNGAKKDMDNNTAVAVIYK